MNLLRNMKIRPKMLVSFMLVIVLIVALVAISAAQMKSIGNSYRIVIKHPLQLERTLQQFHSEYRELRRITATVAVFAGQQAAQYEPLFKEIQAVYDSANVQLTAANTIIITNRGAPCSSSPTTISTSVTKRSPIPGKSASPSIGNRRRCSTTMLDDSARQRRNHTRKPRRFRRGFLSRPTDVKQWMSSAPGGSPSPVKRRFVPRFPLPSLHFPSLHSRHPVRRRHLRPNAVPDRTVSVVAGSPPADNRSRTATYRAP